MPLAAVAPAISVTDCLVLLSSGLCTRSIGRRCVVLPMLPADASIESACVRTIGLAPFAMTSRLSRARMLPPTFRIVVDPTGLSMVPLRRMSDDPRLTISIVVGVTVRLMSNVSVTAPVPLMRSTCGSPSFVIGVISSICSFIVEALTIRIFSRLSENFQVPPLPLMTSAWSDACPGTLVAAVLRTFRMLPSMVGIRLIVLSTTPFAPTNNSALERP